MAEWWEAAPLVSPAPPAPTLYGRPKVEKPDKPNLPAGYFMGPDGVARRYEGLPPPKGEDGEGQDPALTNAIRNLGLDELLTGVQRARTNIDTGWATGAWGTVAELKPGGATPRDDFIANLNQIQGGIILEKLQALKEASKTGASGMGALSEKEGERLAASVAALSKDMSPEALKNSLADIERHARTLQAVAAGKDPTDPEVAKEFKIEALPNLQADQTRRPDDGGDDVKSRRLTATQQAEYAALLGTKPDAKTINDWWIKNGWPDGVNAEEIAQGLREGKAVSTGVDYSKIDDAANAAARAEIARTNESGVDVDGNVGTMLKSGGMGLLGDEASGVGYALGNALTSPITGDLDPVGNYQLGRNAQRLRIADIREQLGWKATALEVAGGLMSANPQAALAPFVGRTGLVGQGMKAGAYGGALMGYGGGEGAQDSITDAAIGGGLGTVLGGTIAGASSRYAPRGNPAVAQAALDEGMSVPGIMVTGARRDINRLGVMEADSATAPVIQQGLASVNDQIGTRVSNLGQGGTSMDRAPGGEMVREIAKGIKAADQDAATAAYKAAEAIDGDPPIDPAKMRVKLDAEIARLQRTPNTNEDAIRELQKYRRDIDQPIPLSALRAMKTSIQGEISGAGLARTSGQKLADRRMMAAINGTREDIEAGLSKEAFEAYRTADAMHSGNQQFIREALIPFVGKDFDQLPAEQIFDRLKAATNRNGKALATLHRRLTPDQSRDIAATFAETLGKRGPDEEFSTALFISQARKLSPSARETLFGPSGKSSFDNLLRLSRALEKTKAEINRSKTARPVMNAIRQRAHYFVTGLIGMGGVGGYAAGGPAGAGLALVAGSTLAAGSGAMRGLSARALMNPRVTRWLEAAADTKTPAQAQENVRRLGVVISREPALAGELQPIHDFLTQRLATPLAASEPQPEGQNDE